MRCIKTGKLVSLFVIYLAGAALLEINCRMDVLVHKLAVNILSPLCHSNFLQTCKPKPLFIMLIEWT